MSLDTMNQESLAGSSSLYSSTFAQVIFVNVEKQYTTDVAVKCNYTLTPRITPHKNDWIGIFKVGWSTARDYHTFVWAPLPKQAGQVEHQQQVTFEAYYLPKDEKLEETEREKDELRENNQRLTTENAKLRGKIKELETQAAREREENSAALKVNQDLLAQVESAQASLEQLKQKNEKDGDKLRQLQQENERLRAEIGAKEDELASLTEVKNESEGELKATQERLQLVQYDFETQKKENVALKEDLMKLAEVQNQQRSSLAEISQLCQALGKSEELKASNANAVEELQEQVGNLQQCLKDMEKQVQSAQQQQVQTMVELKVARASQEQSEKSLCEAQQEIQHWKSKFEKVDEIFSKNEGKCTELACELDLKTRSLEVRDAKVAGLQEDVERLTKTIDELRLGTSHQSGAFELQHANPYSGNVPTAPSAHPELLFGNPYFERDFPESPADQFVDVLNALENSQDAEEDLSLISQKCPVCFFPFDPAMDQSVMDQHISTHFGHECPICRLHFPENRQTQYADHVQSHFAATN
ncbi:uncharacterized protein [Mobula birostris]|uniref:uncharacterized protein n=1 Tax=Mobula birostris TaxID=1983395 RepID=UPI003B28D30B